jgi:Signal transduction histidine kinase
MRYDKHNKKLVALQKGVERLQTENEFLNRESQSIKEILDSTLHEVRRFSAQLLKFAERLSRDTDDQPQLHQTALSLFYTAGMMSSRLAYTDIELNPKALESQTPIRSGIYKKFDKVKRILAEEARNRDVNIQFKGESRVEIDALPVFELLPFVLLDNGIKYSPPNQIVTVKFEEYSGRQIVTMSSMGPTVNREEFPKLFDKGFRGASTKSMPGQGLGLFLAKSVCDYHGITIRAESRPGASYQLNGIDYAEFWVELRF